ncbi:MAG TPA: hypothetical protein VJQ58_09225, partial [Burkholderiales bacterium]|nr:hypothetical protein [Burkholderiales bacterium]
MNDVITDCDEFSGRESYRAPRLRLADAFVCNELLDGIKDNGELFVVAFSRASILRASWRFESIKRRNCTKVRMMAMFTSTARGERSTLESIATR